MINKAHQLPESQQAKLFKISPGMVYQLAAVVSVDFHQHSRMKIIVSKELAVSSVRLPCLTHRLAEPESGSTAYKKILQPSIGVRTTLRLESVAELHRWMSFVAFNWMYGSSPAVQY